MVNGRNGARPRGKLELTWVGKENRPRLEPRILIEDRKLSHGDPNAENMLIHGDNLLALKALEQEFAGTVKCIYIDPPYNTGAAFEHYDDSVEHSVWLSLMRDRLALVANLLRSDGLVFVHIDDSEAAYLKVLMDEVFGRHKYLISFYVQVRYAEKTLKQDMLFNKVIEQIHCYGGRGDPVVFQPVEEYDIRKFCWYVEETGGPRTTELAGKKVEIFGPGCYRLREGHASQSGLKEIWATGAILDGNSSGRFFRDYLQSRTAEDGLGVLYKVYGIGDDELSYRYFTGPKRSTATKGKYYQGLPKRVVSGEAERKITISNFIDMADAFGNCRHEGGVEFRSGKKPEILIKQLLELATQPGDLVLDSFAGSGTTGAVAHKMGRRWIMVELEEHCYTHIVPRLRSVVEGTDQTGISEAVGWKGGGGFKFYRLAESLLVTDKDLSTRRRPVYVINPKYDSKMLVRAICKIENFRYLRDNHWHGASSEHHFLYVTTSLLSQRHLDSVSAQLGDEEALLIYCTRRTRRLRVPDNIEVKKIPRDLLAKCSFEEDRV